MAGRNNSGRKSFASVGYAALGACGLAPAVVYDNEVAGKVMPNKSVSKLQMGRSSLMTPEELDQHRRDRTRSPGRHRSNGQMSAWRPDAYPAKANL